MSLEGQETEIRIGRSGADRFIGIQPPLTDQDIQYLVQEGTVSQQDVSQVTGEIGHTLVTVTASGTEEGKDRVVRARVMRIAYDIEFTRGRVGMMLNNIVDITEDRSKLFD